MATTKFPIIIRLPLSKPFNTESKDKCSDIYEDISKLKLDYKMSLTSQYNSIVETDTDKLQFKSSADGISKDTILVLGCLGKFNDEDKYNPSLVNLKELLNDPTRSGDKTNISALEVEPYKCIHTVLTSKINYITSVLIVNGPIIKDYKIDDKTKKELILTATNVGIELSKQITSAKVNIMLGRIFSYTETIDKRYYLNYARDLMLHTLITVLIKKNKINDVETIQYLDEDSNGYDIYGGKLLSKLNYSNDIDERLKYIYDYYTYNGNYYLSAMNDINVIVDQYNEGVFNIPDPIDVTLSSIKNNVKLIKDTFTETITIDNTITKTKFTKNGANNMAGVTNLCWFNSVNQLILSIPEIQDFFYNYTGTNVLINLLKTILKTYDGNQNDQISFSKESISLIKLLQYLKEKHGYIFTNIFEAFSYINIFFNLHGDDIVSHDISDKTYFDILYKIFGTLSKQYNLMLYPSFKKKAVTYTGSYLYNVNPFNTNIPNDNLFCTETDVLNNLKNNSLDIFNIELSYGYKYACFRIIKTNKYIFLSLYNELGNNCNLIEKIEFNEYNNNNKYEIKSFVINNNNGHYFCYKKINDEYYLYDDLQNNAIKKTDLFTNGIHKLPPNNYAEFVIYEIIKPADNVPDIGKDKYLNNQQKIKFKDLLTFIPFNDEDITTDIIEKFVNLKQINKSEDDKDNKSEKQQKQKQKQKQKSKNLTIMSYNLCHEIFSGKVGIDMTHCNQSGDNVCISNIIEVICKKSRKILNSDDIDFMCFQEITLEQWTANFVPKINPPDSLKNYNIYETKFNHAGVVTLVHKKHNIVSKLDFKFNDTDIRPFQILILDNIILINAHMGHKGSIDDYNTDISNALNEAYNKIKTFYNNSDEDAKLACESYKIIITGDFNKRFDDTSNLKFKLNTDKFIGTMYEDKLLYFDDPTSKQVSGTCCHGGKGSTMANENSYSNIYDHICDNVVPNKNKYYTLSLSDIRNYKNNISDHLPIFAILPLDKPNNLPDPNPSPKPKPKPKPTSSSNPYLPLDPYTLLPPEMHQVNLKSSTTKNVVSLLHDMTLIKKYLTNPTYLNNTYDIKQQPIESQYNLTSAGNSQTQYDYVSFMPKRDLPSIFVENDILGTNDGVNKILKSINKPIIQKITDLNNKNLESLLLQRESLLFQRESLLLQKEPIFYIDYSNMNIPNDILSFNSKNQAIRFMNRFK